MKRDKWSFEYKPEQILEAVAEKINFHNQQLEFWQNKREEIISTIRAEGIEINEKISIRQGFSKARDFENGGEVMIRNDLRKGLSEVYEKLKYHTKRRDIYDGWSQLLKAKPGIPLSLDITDWTFFFGRDTNTRENEFGIEDY